MLNELTLTVVHVVQICVCAGRYVMYGDIYCTEHITL